MAAKPETTDLDGGIAQISAALAGLLGDAPGWTTRVDHRKHIVFVVTPPKTTGMSLPFAIDEVRACCDGVHDVTLQARLARFATLLKESQAS
jgi:hypothetical protein